MATSETNTTDLAHAEILWEAVDTLRGQGDAAEYKHVVLGLLFLKYISDAFEARREERKVELQAEGIADPQIESLLKTRDVGAEEQEDDDEPFAEKYPRLLAELEACFGEGERLMGVVRERLKRVGDAG